jgi:phosphate transport system ATP-binding protein
VTSTGAIGGGPERGHVVLENFSAWFGSKRALARVDLDLPARAVTAVVGPSGCGKTTLLRALNRLNELIPGATHDGRVLLDGTDVHGAAVDVSSLRQRVGMVFQRSNPFPRSIFDNVAYGPRLNRGALGREVDELVERALRRAALWEETRDRLRESALDLSGGQQQRLCIARALANEPEVLLLDEPTSALDPTATQRIEELLYELRRELTIVLVTHNLQQAARVSDRTVFLADGALVETDETKRLFTSPRDPRTEAFITGRFG